MQFEDIIKYLTKSIHLTLEETATAQRIYPVVLHFFRRHGPADAPIALGNVENGVEPEIRIQLIRQNLQTLVDFFQSYDASCEEYVKKFPEWENVRKQNIEQLERVANSLGKSRKICNVTKCVSGSVGATGGAAVLISLSAAVPLMIPVVGGIAVTVGGFASLATSIAETVELKKHLNKAKKICKIDESNFELLEKWLRQSDELRQRVHSLINFNIWEKMLSHLSEFRRERALLSDHLFDKNLKFICNLIVTTKTKNPLFSFGIEGAAVITTSLIAMILFHRRTPSMLHTSKLGLGVVNGIQATTEVGKLIAFAGSKGQALTKLIPSAVGKKVAFKAIAGVGIAVDVAMIVLSSIELAKDQRSEEEKMIIAVANLMEDERRVLREVYARVVEDKF